MNVSRGHIAFLIHLKSVQTRLSVMRSCGEDVDRLLVEEAQRTRERVVCEAGGSSSIAEEILAEEPWLRVRRVEEILPYVVQHAFFASCVSDFETQMLLAAKVSQRLLGLSVGVGDLKGDGLQKAGIYFKKVAALDVPTDSAEWSDLMRIGKIRNAIVHNDSRIQNDDIKGIQDFVASRFTEVQCDQDGQIAILSGATSRLIDLQLSFVAEFTRRYYE